MSQPKQQVGILLIATNKYKQFVQPLIDSIGKYFLSGTPIKIFLFTDDLDIPLIPPHPFMQMERFEIPSYKFPEATLYRYKIFNHFSGAIFQSNCSHVFYMDVDMKVVAPVGEEILGDIVATLHPGFYNGGGSWGNNPVSLSYTLRGHRKKYYAGGFQGGKIFTYLCVARKLNERIDQDKASGIIAEWHDETHWNWYLATNPSYFVTDPLITELTPDYCMVEQQHLREQWGIAHFTPKIIALEKDHAAIRS